MGPNGLEGYQGIAQAEKSVPGGVQRPYSREFRWADTRGSHSMPAPEELEYFGYVYFERDGMRVVEPRFRSSILMVREIR